MTRKDYIVIADAFRKAYAWCDAPAQVAAFTKSDLDTARQGINIAVQEVAFALAQDNGRFDPARFRRAIFDLSGRNVAASL